MFILYDFYFAVLFGYCDLSEYAISFWRFCIPVITSFELILERIHQLHYCSSYPIWAFSQSHHFDYIKACYKITNTTLSNEADYSASKISPNKELYACSSLRLMSDSIIISVISSASSGIIYPSHK